MPRKREGVEVSFLPPVPPVQAALLEATASFEEHPKAPPDANRELAYHLVPTNYRLDLGED